MPATKKSNDDVPQFFRLNVEVGNLDEAIPFYTKLLAVDGRKQPGARCYFECGPVTLSVLDVSSARKPHPAAKALYFTVKDLDAAFDRAKELGCLSQESVHDEPGGGIVVRPWGERSSRIQPGGASSRLSRSGGAILCHRAGRRSRPRPRSRG